MLFDLPLDRKACQAVFRAALDQQVRIPLLREATRCRSKLFLSASLPPQFLLLAIYAPLKFQRFLYITDIYATVSHNGLILTHQDQYFVFNGGVTVTTVRYKRHTRLDKHRARVPHMHKEWLGSSQAGARASQADINSEKNADGSLSNEKQCKRGASSTLTIKKNNALPLGLGM